MIHRKNVSHLFLVTALVIGFGSIGCGSDDKHTDRRSKDADAVVPFDPEDHYIVRGRWEIPISVGDSDDAKSLNGFSFFGTAKNSTPMTASVATAVTFTVDGTNFIAPINPENSASYGTLDITDLSDNSLRQCGVSGTTRCTTGAIRVYTSGTTGGGLWNEIEQYGLPITSRTNAVGLDAAAAFVAATANIGRTNVLKLRHFNVGTKLQIPIEVDFSDAASGSYATTIIVEYVIQ